MNHTRFPKEVHLPDWVRQDNKVTKGDRVESLPRIRNSTHWLDSWRTRGRYCPLTMLLVTLHLLSRNLDWIVNATASDVEKESGSLENNVVNFSKFNGRTARVTYNWETGKCLWICLESGEEPRKPVSRRPSRKSFRMHESFWTVVCRTWDRYPLMFPQIISFCLTNNLNLLLYGKF